MTNEPVQPTTSLVVGAGASGCAAAELLLALGQRVRVYDRNPSASIPSGATGFLGEDEAPASSFTGVDNVVLSPGVPPERPRALAAEHAPAATITGELGLALQLIETVGVEPWRPVPTVLVTGTNGKSTVTALTGELLRQGGLAPFTGGNLGTPLCRLLLDVLTGRHPWPGSLVLECSSFQLETLPRFAHAVGIVLNVTPDHLDRYATMTDYAATKGRVFRDLARDGLALIDEENPYQGTLLAELPQPPPRLVHVGRSGEAVVEGDGSGRSLVLGEERYDRALLALPGRHNASNALFALAAARHLGVSPAACKTGLSSFRGLPHRMVLVRELDGVRWYNDSKATNVASALASLGGLDQPFVLIAGGRGKGDDLRPLGELLRRRARGLVSIGESAAQFHALAAGEIPAEIAGDLARAVPIARMMAKPGDAVVLAPACASYDQFRSYAHRGDVFSDTVAQLQ